MIRTQRERRRDTFMALQPGSSSHAKRSQRCARCTRLKLKCDSDEGFCTMCEFGGWPCSHQFPDDPVLDLNGQTEYGTIAALEPLSGDNGVPQVDLDMGTPDIYSRRGSLESDTLESVASFHSSRSISLPPPEMKPLYKKESSAQSDLPLYLADPLPSRAPVSYWRAKYSTKNERESSEVENPSPDNGILVPNSMPELYNLSGHHPTPSTSPSTSIPRDAFIPIDCIDHKPIASGGFASIHIGWSLGSKVAMKVIRVSQDNERVARRRLNREIVVWKELDHPNITPLLGVAEYPELSHLELIITPWYDNGSATTYLSSCNPSFEERLNLSLGVATGLSYLHGLNPPIVHGDLKPSNILVDEAGQPRLCDFGLARIINEEARSGLTTTTRHNATPLYAAPEILMAEDDAPPFAPSIASDIYSLGSVIYEFLVGKLPYAHLSTNTQVLLAVIKGKKPATCPDTMIDPNSRRQWQLFEICWSSPDTRPDALTVIEELQGLKGN